MKLESYLESFKDALILPNLKKDGKLESYLESFKAFFSSTGAGDPLS